MKKKSMALSAFIVFSLLMAGCGNQTLPVAEGNNNPEAESTEVVSEPSKEEFEADSVSATGPYGEISVSLPGDWDSEEAPVDSDKMMYGLYGLVHCVERFDITAFPDLRHKCSSF